MTKSIRKVKHKKKVIARVLTATNKKKLLTSASQKIGSNNYETDTA